MWRILLGYLLNLLYLLAVLLALPWLAWSAFVHGKYREGYAAKLLGRVPCRTGESGCIWLHAVSVGEVNVLGTIIAELEARRPDLELFVSATTTTGFNLARRRFATHTVFYCPLDFTWAVAAALRRIRPDLLVLAELELWPNLVTAAQQRGAAIAIVNGRLSDKSFRGYRRFRWFVAGLLQRISLIAVQDKTTADRFLDLGAAPERVHVTGSLKYDGAQTNRNNPATARLRGLAQIAAGDVVLLAGSTQEPEEELVLAAYRSLMADFPELRLIIVPRHPQRFDAVADLLNRSGITWMRRTAFEPEMEVRRRGTPSCGEKRPHAISNHHARPVLLVDTIGELGAWWGTADIAFVGGSLGSRGGQNMIEPAAYGAAVCFGPNTRNFRDIVGAMVQASAARVVTDGTGLTAFIRRCLEDPAWAAGLGERARQLVLTQLGATDKTLALLEPLLPCRICTSDGDASLDAA